MLIPNGKKYLVYIKTAKTGGTTFTYVLKNIATAERVGYWTMDELEQVKHGDIIMIVNDQIRFFMAQYPHIFSDSYYVTISRNPYSRILSGWKYHKMTKNRTLSDLLTHPIVPPMKPYEVEWKKHMPKETWDLFSVYNHFYVSQTEPCVINGRFIIDYIIRFEDFNENVKTFFDHIKCQRVTIPHLNKSKNNVDVKQFKEPSLSSTVPQINKLFHQDFMLLGYPMLDETM